jgi:5'(3')-deoxyribonucleotidase
MDGVLVDFVTAAFRTHGKEPDLQNWPIGQYELIGLLGVTDEEFWTKIDNEGLDWWLNLDPLPWCKDLWHMLQSYGKVYVASKPHKHPNSAHGKIRWLHKHIDDKLSSNDYIFGGSKFLLANPQSILVDDSVQQCNDFVKHGGYSVVFPQPWSIGAVADPVAHVQEGIRSVRDMIYART